MYATMIRELRENAVQRAQRARHARYEVLVLIPLIVAVVLAYKYRVELFGVDEPIRIASGIALVVLGWAFARTFVRALAPPLLKQLGQNTAASVSFLIRLVFLCVAILVALRIAGLQPRDVAIGGAITAVIIGLAAQQTLGNVIAGIVLLSARPFRAGQRVRFQGSGLGGDIEGTVDGLGLMYTTLDQGAETVMVPNSVILASAVVPLSEAASVDLRARLRPGINPSAVQKLLESAVVTEMREEPHIALEEIHADEVIVRISATPQSDDDGPRLANEIIAAIAPVTSGPGAAGTTIVEAPRPDGEGEDGAGAGEPTQPLPGAEDTEPRPARSPAAKSAD